MGFVKSAQQESRQFSAVWRGKMANYFAEISNLGHMEILPPESYPCNLPVFNYFKTAHQTLKSLSRENIPSPIGPIILQK